MRRRMAAALALALILVISPGRAESYEWPEWRWKTCKTKPHNGSWQVRQLIRCVDDHWPAPGGARKAIAVARCESGLNPKAYANGNAGLFQQRVIYWRARFADLRPPWPAWDDLSPSVYSPRSNAVISVRMARRVGTWARDWRACGA